MSEYFLYLLILMIAGTLVLVVWKPSRIFEYPYFIASVFAVFIMPQAFSLVRFRGGVTEEDVTLVLLMSCLCLGMAILGYRLPPSKVIVQFFSRPADPGRLLQVGWGLIAVGVLSTVMLTGRSAKFSEEGGLTGALTIVIFFSGLAYPGFAICLTLLRERVTPMRLLGTVFGSIVPFFSLFHGRREPAVVFLLIVLLTRFYRDRKAPNPILIFSGLVFMMLAIPATGQYRQLMYQGRASEFRKIDLIGNFKEFVTSESLLELRNAAALMRSTRLMTELELGAGYWDYIVFRFVPAQIVGREVKDSLMISGDSKNIYKRKLATNYELPVGSTITGMGCSFEQFGWFGCLFFAIQGMMVRSLWIATLQRHAIFGQLLYILIVSSAMRSVTHQTVDFLPGVIYYLVFIGAAMWYAGLPNPTGYTVQMPQKKVKQKAMPRGRIYGRRPGHGMPLEGPSISDNPHNPRNRP